MTQDGQVHNRKNSGIIVVSQRRHRTVFFGLMIAVLIVGMAASLSAQPTVSGRVTAVVFFGILIALCAGLWVLANRRRNRIEVTRDAIGYRHWSRRTDFTLSRQRGDDLRIIPRLRDHGFVVADRLTIVGSGDIMNLFGFSPHAVKRACEAGGWRFGTGTPAQAEHDLRRWHEEGRAAEAAQLVDLFGPYDVDAGADATVSLGAAVLEAYADELSGIDPRAARAAYLRAADAQRSYAAFATSGGEGIARMAEADRLTAKADRPIH